MSGGLYHSSLQVCIGICGGEGTVIKLCALHAERWSHIKRKHFPLRALSLSSSPSVQLKSKLWLTAADPRVITHDRGSLGSKSLCQKSTEERPVCMCMWGTLVRTEQTDCPSSDPTQFRCLSRLHKRCLYYQRKVMWMQWCSMSNVNTFAIKSL